MENKYFVKIDKDLVKGEPIVGEVYSLEVTEIGEKITFQLKKIEDSEEDSERVKFYDIFNDYNGGLENKIPVQISGIKFGEKCKIGEGITFGGINFLLYKNRDLAVIKKKDYWIIVGIY